MVTAIIFNFIQSFLIVSKSVFLLSASQFISYNGDYADNTIDNCLSEFGIDSFK